MKKHCKAGKKPAARVKKKKVVVTTPQNQRKGLKENRSAGPEGVQVKSEKTQAKTA